MRCIIVDDENMSRAHLAHLCKRIESLEIVGTFADALSAYRFLAVEAVDLVFLDVEMPDFSGIELVQQLQQPPAVIFISSKEGYALKVFDFIESVVDYLLKPVTLPRLLKAIERYQRQLATGGLNSQPAAGQPLEMREGAAARHIFVKTERKYVRIDLDDLLYVETMGDYAIFKTTQQQYTVHATLKSIDERLNLPNFFKVHRSFIVNLDKIKDIEDNSLLIKHKVIPISRTHRAQLMDRIMPL